MTGEHEVVAQTAVADGFSLRPVPQTRIDLHYLRASGLAQARLQLAVLSGNRRRALEQIDRLVDIDKQLELMAGGMVAIAPEPGQMESELADQRLAIASEKLALTSAIELPRLEPAFGAGMGAALDQHEDIEIVEDAVVRNRLFHILLWSAGFLILCLGVAAAVVTQL